MGVGEGEGGRGMFDADYTSRRVLFERTTSCYCKITINILYDDNDVELHVLGCRADISGTNCNQCVCKVQCCFTSTETVKLIRTGSPGRPPSLPHSSLTLEKKKKKGEKNS